MYYNQQATQESLVLYAFFFSHFYWPQEQSQWHVRDAHFFLTRHNCNGKKSELSPIRSVIIRVINKIGRLRSGCPICLVTSMITDCIGRREVLLPINHNFNKICDILGSFFKFRDNFCWQWKKKPFKRARDGGYWVQSLRHDTYCPISAAIRAVDSQSDLRILL